MRTVPVFQDIFLFFQALSPGFGQEFWDYYSSKMPYLMYINFTLCEIDPWEDGQVMKEDGKLGVSDDKESIFSSLKSRNSCLTPVGHEGEKMS